MALLEYNHFAGEDIVREGMRGSRGGSTKKNNKGEVGGEKERK